MAQWLREQAADREHPARAGSIPVAAFLFCLCVVVLGSCLVWVALCRVLLCVFVGSFAALCACACVRWCSPMVKGTASRPGARCPRGFDPRRRLFGLLVCRCVWLFGLRCFLVRSGLRCRFVVVASCLLLAVCFFRVLFVAACLLFGSFFVCRLLLWALVCLFWFLCSVSRSAAVLAPRWLCSLPYRNL